MKIALLIVIVVLLGGLGYIRLAPSEPGRWNVDPVTATDPGKKGVLLAPGKADFNMPPTELLTKLDGIIRAHPRTVVLAGIPGDLQITYQIRSKWLGFPDYLTVKAIANGQGGSTLAVLSRLRFGLNDQGVNRKRLDFFLSQVRQISS